MRNRSRDSHWKLSLEETEAFTKVQVSMIGAGLLLHAGGWELLGDARNETLQPEGEGTGTGPWAKKQAGRGKVTSFGGACAQRPVGQATLLFLPTGQARPGRAARARHSHATVGLLSQFLMLQKE